jgi:hypothetical protein
VTIERYLIAYDIGRAVNPTLVEGQFAGGFAQGVGGALLEEFLYDDRGEPLCVNFADYLMPTTREVPRLDVLITEDAPSPLNPLGLQGGGGRRHQCRRRGHCRGDRGCDWDCGRGHAAAGEPATAAANPQVGRALNEWADARALCSQRVAWWKLAPTIIHALVLFGPRPQW